MKTADSQWLERYGGFLGWLTLVMVLLSFLTVITRNVFSVVWIPIQELAIYCHAAALMLGMVYAWHHDRHVRVDVFYQSFSAAKKRLVNLAGTWLLMVPMMLFMIYACYQYVVDSWLRLEGSGETGGLPLVFVFKTLLLLMPISMLGYVFIVSFRKPPNNQQPGGTD
ncbi:TRAP transporter small permease subunit [Marinicella sp. S1101]|uniref:TRAP transporter small permease subunit n=1 Tax=Marinicella marina TaxID=2996016 RepID=UPI002260FA0E|nr:TRAP transporter small permease subunit [Marinicella marina]MCX7554288.1 TRAP transporter small permease subunit [Marinicella marina]MDJ1138721.1 TRAP transporter small permease subunit [Marinicella marina]